MTGATNLAGVDLSALRAAFDGHDLGPPLGWAAVEAFEQTSGIVLPEPYRSFVATVGNGCADGPPLYGLVRLDPAVVPDRLARRFPLTAAWVWEDEPDADPDRIDAVLRDGLLRLGHDGCGIDWALVVTGEHRGQVWQLTDVGAQPYGRPFGWTTAEPGFAGWVARWATTDSWFDA